MTETEGGLEKLAEVANWRGSTLFSEAERGALEYAERITYTDQKVDDELVDRLKKHFTEAQIVELTLRITLCGFFNRFNDALRIEEEEEAHAALAAVDGH